MTSLRDFIAARLDEDWEIACEASQDGDAGNTWSIGARRREFRQEARIGDDRDDLVFDELLAFLTRFDPARVLREVQAKRRILKEHSTPHTVVDGFCTECGSDLHDGVHKRDRSYCEIHGWRECETVLALAAIYSDHPDYRKEWAA